MARSDENERQKALEETVAKIEKRFGRGAIMRLGEASARIAVEAIPSGSLALDMALRVGGIPRGRVTEIFGPESSGKSTLAQHIVAEVQKTGQAAVYIDVEHALDPDYAGRCGMNIHDLFISQPDSGEQALEIADAVVSSGSVGVVVIDSVAALVPEAEIKGEMGDTHVGLQARLMSQALRKLTSSISKTRTIMLFLNQLREKIGVTHGNPEITPGGRALKFYSSVRISLRRVDSIREGTEVLGNRVRATVVKNKVAPPFGVAEFDIMFGRGIAREGEILDLGVDVGMVNKKGAWYQWDAQMLGQGREAAKDFLRQHQDIAARIEQLIRSSSRPVKVSGNGHEQSEESLMATTAESWAAGATDERYQEGHNEAV